MNESNDISSVAYCGLCCLDCHGYTGRVADLARDLRKELRAYKYDKFAHSMAALSFGKAFQDYDKCYDVLGAMVKMRCGKTCRTGSGNPTCKIKNCVTKKKIQGCWECNEFEKCEKLQFLNTNHGVAHLKNLRIIKKKGTAGFEKGEKHWYQTK